MMKLWHDDVRKPPDETWNWARTNDAARELLLRQPYDIASLDHDLGLEYIDPDTPDADELVARGDWPRDDGEELAKWLRNHPHVCPKVIRIHSWNPVGALSMAHTLVGVAENVIVRKFNPDWRTDDPDFPR